VTSTFAFILEPNLMPTPVESQCYEARVGARRLPGTLTIPEQASAAVLFAHGSGSSRLSPRNQFVARQLEQAGLATLLMDLLTEREAADRSNVFDIAFLADRVGEAIEWLGDHSATAGMKLGLFGASTGAAAALVAAADSGPAIGAVVSRGGRPDLAGTSLGRVRAPTLLIVGGADTAVLDLNRDALTQLPPQSRLEVVPGATHLFPEPGALPAVAELAREWFVTSLRE
jgi:putative phosphoribosyl transferase